MKHEIHHPSSGQAYVLPRRGMMHKNLCQHMNYTPITMPACLPACLPIKIIQTTKYFGSYFLTILRYCKHGYWYKLRFFYAKV